ncbi:hypothetical protein PanWU01x14_103480, partial [Parasponia andersonii]
ITGTYNTLFRVNFFLEVIFKTILPWPLIADIAEFPINNFSPFSSSLKEMNNPMSEHMCRVVLVSSYHSLGLNPTRFTLEVIVQRSMSKISYVILSIVLISFFFFFGSRHSEAL